MNYALGFNAAVNLIVGITLLLAWWRDRRQVFSRDLGWAYLTQGFVPLAYVTMHAPFPLAQALGSFLLVVLAALYLALVLLGTARLAGLAPTRLHSVIVTLAL
ncbi:MAG: hypothetical protein H7Y33_19790, partial [Cytophagales bacterium]|nr:hypothetical protein [Rhizobacter sp.]